MQIHQTAQKMDKFSNSGDVKLFLRKRAGLRELASAFFCVHRYESSREVFLKRFLSIRIAIFEKK